jgi:Flp pilus assembly pilin Flp
VLDRLLALIFEIHPPVNRSERGQGLAEYALILGLIAVVAIVALLFMGNNISQLLSSVGNSM